MKTLRFVLPALGILASGALFAAVPARAGEARETWSVRSDSGRGRVVATRLRDGALSTYSLGPVSPGVSASPAVCIGGDGRAAAAWVDSREGRYRIRLSVFGDGGWSGPENVAESARLLTTPSVACSGEGTLWLAWTRFDGEDDEIVAARRRPAGSVRTWTVTRNSVPDILPAVVTRGDDVAEIAWLGFDGRAYSPRRSVFDGQAWSEPAAERAAQAPGAVFIGTEAGGDAPAGAPEEAAGLLLREGEGPTKVAWSDSRGTWSGPVLALGASAGEIGAPAPSIPCPDGLTACAGYDRTIFMAVGDSITYGRGSRWNGPPTDYPTRLENLLKGPWVARNRGIPGQTSAQVLARIGDDLARCRPGLTILMIGVNDAFLGINTETTMFNIRQAAAQVAAQGGKLLLATTTPVQPDVLPTTYHVLSVLNPKILAFAKASGYPCVNLWAAFRAQPGWQTTLMYSKNHPNDRGYDLMAARFRSAVLASGLLNGPADWVSVLPLAPGQLTESDNAPAAVPLLADGTSPLAATGISSVAAADLDGDGVDEIVVAAGDATQTVTAFSAPCLGAAPGDLASQVVPIGSDAGAMAAGSRITNLFGIDLDGDGRDEIGLVRWVQSLLRQRVEVWRAFQPGQTTPVRLLLDGTYLPAGGWIRDIAAFQADGDPAREIAVLAESAVTGVQTVLVYDQLPADGSAPNALKSPLLYRNRWTLGQSLLRLAGQDVDGDGLDELVLLRLNPGLCSDSLEAWRLPALPALAQDTSPALLLAGDSWARVSGREQFAVQPLSLRDGPDGAPRVTLGLWRVR